MIAIIKALIKTIIVIGIILLLFLLCCFKPVIFTLLFAVTITFMIFIGFYLDEEE